MADTFDDKSYITLRSTAETIARGHIAVNVPSVLRIKSGQIVKIDTVSHKVLMEQDPVTYFGKAGIQAEQLRQDAIDIYQRTKRPEGAGGHIITGPIHIEDAQAGDMLEVRVLNMEFRVPYGVNSTGSGSGVLPDLLPEKAAPRTIPLDLKRNVALFSNDIEIPLAPFMGNMVVAPPPDEGSVSTRPPGYWGGNMDLKHLTTGATLYLRVFNTGALFSTGDGHAAMGDGEIDGNAIETSLTPTLQFIVHKGGGTHMKWPRAENPTHYFLMGMAPDLDTALNHAARETVEFLQQKAGLSASDAYALASLSVDFRIGEAVNKVKMVYGMVPKNLFKRNPPYWYPT